MASVAELEAVVLKGELKDIYRKYKLSNAPTREATTQNTEEYALSSPLHPVNIEIEQETGKIMGLAFEEVDAAYMWGLRTVLIYCVILWSVLWWAW